MTHAEPPTNLKSADDWIQWVCAVVKNVGEDDAKAYIAGMLADLTRLALHFCGVDAPDPDSHISDSCRMTTLLGAFPPPGGNALDYAHVNTHRGNFQNWQVAECAVNPDVFPGHYWNSEGIYHYEVEDKGVVKDMHIQFGYSVTKGMSGDEHYWQARAFAMVTNTETVDTWMQNNVTVLSSVDFMMEVTPQQSLSSGPIHNPVGTDNFAPLPGHSGQPPTPCNPHRPPIASGLVHEHPSNADITHWNSADKMNIHWSWRADKNFPNYNYDQLNDNCISAKFNGYDLGTIVLRCGNHDGPFFCFTEDPQINFSFQVNVYQASVDIK